MRVTGLTVTGTNGSSVVELNVPDAIQLARDLIDAANQMGFTVGITVERKPPTEQQLETAVQRVAHIRRHYASAAWNHERTNREIVMRVLEACL